MEQPQVFVITDNSVVLELNFFRESLFAFFGVHFVFNLEYPKKLRHYFQFLEEYVFSIQQKNRITDYRKGVAKLLD